jgi:hypothetical protein
VAADAATAVAHVAKAAPAAREAAYASARNLVRQSHRRERAALAPLRRLAPRAPEVLAAASARLESSLGAELDALERAYTAITGRKPPNLDLSKEERAMAVTVFVPVADVGTFKDAIEKAKPVETLHAMMRFEALNFADGKRSVWEVYEAVAAEALAAGEWYYGAVSPEDVMETLERAARAGAFTVRAQKP